MSDHSQMTVTFKPPSRRPYMEFGLRKLIRINQKMTDYNLLINKSNQIHRFVCRIHLFAWFSLLLLFHRFLGLLLDFFLPPFIPAIIILLSLAVAHRGITVISVYRQGRIFFFFFFKEIFKQTLSKREKKEENSLFSNVIIFLARIEGHIWRKKIQIFVTQQSNETSEIFRND